MEERSGSRSRRRLDRRTRLEALRLAARGERHPEPELSRAAYEWASDRLRVSPLRREILIVVGSGLLVFVAVLAVLFALHQDIGFLAGVALATIAGMCGWTLYMHRRVEQVARVNRES